MKKYDALTHKVGPLLWAYTVPSVLGMLLTTTAIMVDGIFVGKVVHSDALASLNYFFPVASVIGGIIYMVVIGVMTVCGKLLGEKREQSARELYTQGFLFLLVSIIVSSLLIILYRLPLLQFLQVPPEAFVYVNEYLIFYSALSVGMGINIYLLYSLRLAGFPSLYGWLFGLTSILNILLDYLFIVVFGWGMMGAAVGTMGSHILLIPISLSLLSGKKSILHFTRFGRKDSSLPLALSNGLSQFLISISLGVVIYFINLILTEKYDSAGVSAFTIINYVLNISLYVFFGIGEAMQTLLSQNFGGRKRERMVHLLRLGLVWSTLFGFVVGLALNLWVLPFSSLFMNSDDKNLLLIQEVTAGLTSVIWFSQPFAGANIILSSYFIAVHKPFASISVSLGRSFIFFLPLLKIFTMFMEGPFPFLAMPGAEILALLLGLLFLWRHSPRRLLEGGDEPSS